jgi:hypothetical protein
MLKTVSNLVGLTGTLNYQGVWNASTNNPTLTSSVGVLNNYYVVSVAGSTNLNGITNWQVGDWAIFNGTVWEKVDGGSYGAVTQVQGNGTVNGITLTGNVTTTGNLTLGGTLSNVTNAQLQNSAITITGTSVPLGGSISTIPVANVAGAVPNTTYIIAGSGLTGGGALTGNVTLTATNTNSGTVTQVQGNGTVNGITLTGNVTTSGNLTLGGTLGGIANSQLANSSTTLGNATLTLGSTTSTVGNLTLANVTISSGTQNVQVINHTAVTTGNATYGTSSLLLVPQGFFEYDLNGTVVKVPYYAV